MRLMLFVTLLTLPTPAIVAAEPAEKWTGTAVSDNGPSLKIVIAGHTAVQPDGSAQLTGHFRCAGKCVAHHGTVSATFSNTPDGVGHETIEIDLPKGVICTSDADLDGPFAALPPPVGAEIAADYECDDAGGNPVDTGTMDISRKR